MPESVEFPPHYTIEQANLEGTKEHLKMSGIAIGRLTEERKNWRKEHPPGFHARPIKKADNSTDIMTWEIGIPGKSDTDWEGGVYNVLMEFPDEYPSKVKC